MRFFQKDNFILKEVETHLSEKFGVDIKIHTSDSLGGGCINHASKIDTSVGAFFLKWNGNCKSDMFLREAESLEELRKAADGKLIVPEVFAAKEVDASPGFLVLEYLEPGSGAGNSDEILGRGLATIHQYSAQNFGFYHDNYCGSTPQDNSQITNWAEFFRDNRLGFLLNLIRKERPLPAEEMQVYERFDRSLSAAG